MKEKKVRTLLIVCITTVVLYVFLSASGILHLLGGMFSNFTHPLTIRMAAAAHAFRAFIEAMPDSRERRVGDELVAADLARRELAAAQCVQERDELMQSMHYRTQSNIIGVSARIIGFEIAEPTLAIIDQGSDDGVKLGMAVVAYNGVMIGRVFEASTGRSLVRLLNGGGTSIAVTFADLPNVEALLHTETGGLIIDLLPQSTIIEKNMLVVTAGADERVPAGLIVGRVSDVNQDRSLPYRKAIVDPLVSYRDVRFVIIYSP